MLRLPRQVGPQDGTQCAPVRQARRAGPRPVPERQVHRRLPREAGGQAGEDRARRPPLREGLFVGKSSRQQNRGSIWSVAVAVGTLFNLTSPNRNSSHFFPGENSFQGPYTREDGFLGYNEICEELKEPNNGWNLTWDPHHNVRDKLIVSFITQFVIRHSS